MPSLRDIKKKIQGVKNTQQITRAMKMVSTAKLRKTLDRLKSVDYYLKKLEQIVADLNSVVTGKMREHALFQPRPKIDTIGIMLFSGERGLCGSFNNDIMKATVQFMKSHPCPNKKLFIIGKKGLEFFKRRGVTPYSHYDSLSSPYDVKVVEKVAANAITWYDVNDQNPENQVDELYIIYSHYISALSRKVKITRLLPLETIHGEKKSRGKDIIFDPSPEEILKTLIPKYVTGYFSRAVLESSASEQSARMIAMGAATDRANDMIRSMTLTFNRTRQAIITKELAEVVGGADALAD